MSDELVAELLMQFSEGGPRPAVQKAIRGDVGWDDLDAEDYIDAVEIANGHVCVRWSLSSAGQDYYLSWEPRRAELQAVHKRSMTVVAGERAKLWIRNDARAPSFEAEALLREDTPFGGLEVFGHE